MAKKKTVKAKRLAAMKREISRKKKLAATLRRQLAERLKGKKKASKEVPRRALKDVQYRGYTIFPVVGTTSTGRRFYEADVTKGNTSVDFVTAPTRDLVLSRSRGSINRTIAVGGVPPTPKVVERKRKRSEREKKKVVKVSYAERARILKARLKKRGKKNRPARLGAATKPSRARRERPQGFAYLIQVQDSSTSRAKKKRNPRDIDLGSVSPARAKQIAAAFLRSV